MHENTLRSFLDVTRRLVRATATPQSPPRGSAGARQTRVARASRSPAPMEAQAGCGTAFGLQYLYRFLDAAAKQIMPPEEVTVERTRFAVQRPLGEGGFSYVYLVREVPDARGQDFALKRVLLGDGEDEDEDEAWSSRFAGPARFGNSAVEREIAVMRALDHPNVLPLLRAEVDPSNPRVEANGASNAVSLKRRAHMVFPVFSEGTMLDRCVAKPPGAAFTMKQLLSVARQVCLALVYLHEHETLGPLAHRDVKPGNVLLESSMEQTGGLRAVLMDFGSTRPARISVNDRAGALRVQERAARECTAPFVVRHRRARGRLVARVPAVRGRRGGAVALRGRDGADGGKPRARRAQREGDVAGEKRGGARKERRDPRRARAFAGRGGVPVAERLAGTAHRAGRCDSNRDVARTIKMTKRSRVDILLKSSLRA